MQQHSHVGRLPLPEHYNPASVGTIFHIPYIERGRQAEEFAQSHAIRPAATDSVRTCLLLVDPQNTFCTPGFELFVQGAVEDNSRLCEFIYRNLNEITAIVMTFDTHGPYQIFQPFVWVDDAMQHPVPGTIITEEDLRSRRWRINPRITASADLREYDTLDDDYARYYVSKLAEGHRYPLTIWPPHGMAGSIGHAIVPAIEEAVYFHSIARFAPPRLLFKGESPLTEHYAVFASEVQEDSVGRPVGAQHRGLLRSIFDYDRVVIAGQAKSHCVAWTVEYILENAAELGDYPMRRTYLLEDCTSPVVLPSIHDYTNEANAAFAAFEAAGAHIVRSTVPVAEWEQRERAL
jgi:nicotinamidase-related amidase